MLGVGLIVPVLPDVIRRFVTDQNSINHLFGYFVAIYALTQFLAAPVLGGLSDHFGRRPILLSSLFGASVDYMFMAFASSLPLLFIGRIISGLTGASMTVANSYMADISDDKNRAANFGMIGAAFGIGFIAGPLIGGLLGHISSSAPFIAAAVLNFFNFLFGLFVLPESLLMKHRRKIEMKKLNPFLAISKLLRSPALLYFVSIYTLLFMAGNVHPSIWTLYTEHKFHWTSFQVGISLSFVGLIYGFSQALLSKKLVPKWGEIKALKVGIFFYGLGFLLYALAPAGWMMYAVMALTALSALTIPSLQSIMTKKVGPDRQGELQGGLVSLSSLSSILAPVLYTSSFSWAVGKTEIFNQTANLAGLPYLIAAIIVFFSWLLLTIQLRTDSNCASDPSRSRDLIDIEH
jgi:DHA1 family tetracycline resistance protein-like MFS transporter